MIRRKNLQNIVKNAISKYDNYCMGYSSPLSATGDSYFIGINLCIGINELKYTQSGSKVLDQIIAFDTAEIDEAYIGQLNMSIVSSFCGIQGIIWGYDVYNKYLIEENFKLFELEYNNNKINVYSTLPLQKALIDLFGTVDKRNFPILPGSHSPFACKNIKVEGPIYAFAGIAIGIPNDRETNACLLMEDVGFFTEQDLSKEKVSIKEKENKILKNLANSVIDIGINQRVTYEEIFVGVKVKFIDKNKIGCAMVAVPYFTLAKNALNMIDSNI